MAQITDQRASIESSPEVFYYNIVFFFVLFITVFIQRGFANITQKYFGQLIV